MPPTSASCCAFIEILRDSPRCLSSGDRGKPAQGRHRGPRAFITDAGEGFLRRVRLERFCQPGGFWASFALMIVMCWVRPGAFLHVLFAEPQQFASVDRRPATSSTKRRAPLRVASVDAMACGASKGIRFADPAKPLRSAAGRCCGHHG